MKKMMIALCLLLAMFTIAGCAKDTVESLGKQALTVADEFLSGDITGKAAGERLDVIFNKLGVLADESRTDLSVNAKTLGLKLKVAALKLYIEVKGDVLAIRNEIADAIGTTKK